jgi:S-adenosylmethionine decarboxylase
MDTLKQGMPNSIHILADFSGCQNNLLTSCLDGEKILLKAINDSGLSSILIKSHQFSPEGYTAAALLTESHISLHTWPEFKSVQIDIFTCGEHEKAEKAYQSLKKSFKPTNISEKILFRNLADIKER